MSKVTELGLMPEFAQRDGGAYAGRIVGQTDHYLVQDAGLGKGVLHHRGDMVMTAPVKVGDYVRLSYRAGHAVVRGHESAAGIER